MSTIENEIHDQIVSPLNIALDGKIPPIWPRATNPFWIKEWYEKKGLQSKIAERFFDPTASVDHFVRYYRTTGHAEEVAKALTPFYIESYTNTEFRRYRPSPSSNSEEDLWRCAANDSIRYLFKEEKCFDIFFKKIGIIELIEGCVGLEKRGIGVKSDFLHCFIEAILCGCSFDWDCLYKKAHGEIAYAPTNYIKAKLEYCCIVLAIVMIMRNKCLGEEERGRLLGQLKNGDCWSELFPLYSILTQRVLGSNLNNLNAVVGNYIASHKKYAHLMISCLNFMNGRFKPNLQRKLDGQMAKLNVAMKTEQNDDMDELFSVVFPKSKIIGYSCDSPQLTSGERMRQLAEAKKYNEELVKQLNSLTIENQQLRALSRMAEDAANKGISIEALCDMFNGISDYETCRQMFMQMDYFIHKDEAWKENYDKLRDIVESKRVNMLDVLTKAAENKSGNGKVYVNGDYVMEKHVGHEVNGVASGGVGVRVEACN